jgi:RNase P protein component
VVKNGGTDARLGIAATRKMGDAVERNRAKRLARELFRRHKIDAGLDVIIVPRREMVDAPFATSKPTTWLHSSGADKPLARTPGRPPARGRRRRPAPRV